MHPTTTTRSLTSLAAILLPLSIVAADSASLPDAPRLSPGRKWVHNMVNFARDEVTDELISRLRRAKAAGYNGMVVSDVKFDKFQLATPQITANLARFRQACRDDGMEFIACVAPFGYADVILSNDPNLAEGMPVREATFVVKEGRLVPFDDTARLQNGSLDEWSKHGPTGWSVDEPGKISFRDEAVRHEGRASLRQEEVAAGDKHGRGRLFQKIAVKPWHYYHVSLWIRTEACNNKDWRIFALDANGLNLNWQQPPIQPTQEWTQHHATFCSIDNTEVMLYIGSWNGKQGKVWFDDVRVEPAGFVNILRRDSLPLRVTSLEGTTVYTEGVDFATVVDPKLGNDPNPGYFTNWHEPPVVSIPAGSRLREGDHVLASYHFASTCGKPNNINLCMSEPKTYEIIERQIRWMKEHGQPDAYMFGHDEIRMQGWDDSCVRTGKTSGQVLAECMRRCVAIVKRVDPGKPMVVWNDMFDPYHNAREKDDDGKPHIMYMARGNWSGSWEGLPVDVGVVNWNSASTNSLAFFSKRGQYQIMSGCNDGGGLQVPAWLEAGGRFPGVAGVMYTTWENDYSKLEEFLRHVQAFESGNPAGAR